MNRFGKLTTLAVTAVAVGGLTGGVALAQPSHSSHAVTARPAAATPATESTGPDTDNLQVQEGDQTSPDTPAIAAKAAAPAAQRAVPKVSAQDPGQESENSGESEGTDQSDGPGGHQDPPGDVQHEGGDNEQ